MSKINKILNWLKSGRSLTQVGAIDLCDAYRLSAVVHTLKGRGYDIETELLTVGESTFARYRMVL